MPHCDYPYWDLNKAKTFPMGLNGSYFMNCQSTIMLEDFTIENGATRVAPGTQVRGRFPTAEEFDPIAIQTTGPAGSAMLMTGLLWHCAGVSRSETPRVGILGQLPAEVRQTYGGPARERRPGRDRARQPRASLAAGRG